MRIAVTGASGKLGRVVSAELARAGHQVVRLDQAGDRADDFVRVDLADYGQVADVLAGVNDRHDGLDAVVHLGAIPASGLAADAATFHNNMSATFNVFQAARRARIRTIVYASSETVLGIPFMTSPPYLPVDEEYPTRPESMYALVKHLEEELARKLVRWDPELSITALRFSNVMVPEDYGMIAELAVDPESRKWNLWGYIDARDGAQAVALALEAQRPGFDAFIIAGDDTVSELPSAELAARFHPQTPMTRELAGHETLLSIDKARRVLGYAPKHHWRDRA